MSELSKRSTIYFDPKIHHTLRIKAANSHQTISEIVNDAICMVFREDQEDLEAFEQRVHEPTMSYEELLEDLKSDGKL